MASDVQSAELRRWARLGAESRLAELEAEKAKLLRMFPGLKASAGSEHPSQAPRKRKRRRMSAEARKRISDMMKKRWAERRRGTAKKSA